MTRRFQNTLFAVVPEWVIFSEISDRAVRLYAVLGRHAGPDGSSFPSKARLAEILRCSSMSVHRATQELESIGALRTSVRFNRERQTTNLYTLVYDQMFQSSRVTPVEGTQQRQGGVSPTLPQERESVNESLSSDLTVGSSLSPSQAPADRRDLVFEAICHVCRIDWRKLTPMSRGPLNRVVRELKQVGATPEEIVQKAWTFEIRYPEITITPTALAKFWPSLSGPGNSPTLAHRRTLLQIGEELRNERIRGAKDPGPPALDVPGWEADADGDGEALDDRADFDERDDGLEGYGSGVEVL